MTIVVNCVTSFASQREKGWIAAQGSCYRITAFCGVEGVVEVKVEDIRARNEARDYTVPAGSGPCAGRQRLRAAAAPAGVPGDARSERRAVLEDGGHPAEQAELHLPAVSAQPAVHRARVLHHRVPV